MSTSLQNQILQSYDNKVLSGVQVRSAIQQYIRSTDLTCVLCSVNDTKLSPQAIVGAEDFNPRKITTKILPSTTDTKIYRIYTDELDLIEGFDITATDYTTAAINSKKQTSMAVFNDIGKAGTTYINTSSNYRSYILRVANTDTIVGIVFITYDN